MNQQLRPPGKTTIAPEVLISIARLTALGVDGVSRLASSTTDFGRFFNIPETEGVRINIKDGRVYADLFVVVNDGINLREVSRSIQTRVARAITQMVGMPVGRVNIHIEDIDYIPSSVQSA